jgi:hypothetical protein
VIVYSYRLYLNYMSGKYGQTVTSQNKFSSTAASFSSSNVYRQEEVIREIVQGEMAELLEDIKVEI